MCSNDAHTNVVCLLFTNIIAPTVGHLLNVKKIFILCRVMFQFQLPFFININGSFYILSIPHIQKISMEIWSHSTWTLRSSNTWSRIFYGGVPLFLMIVVNTKKHRQTILLYTVLYQKEKRKIMNVLRRRNKFKHINSIRTHESNL